jgi:hypothetical protein
VTALARLAEAVAVLPVQVIQISAAGVSETASTAFFRTKAQGDRVLSARAKNWIILRPTLVLSHEAYGGTALLRAVAALPLIQPRICQRRRSRRFTWRCCCGGRGLSAGANTFGHDRGSDRTRNTQLRRSAGKGAPMAGMGRSGCVPGNPCVPCFGAGQSGRLFGFSGVALPNVTHSA